MPGRNVRPGIRPPSIRDQDIIMATNIGRVDCIICLVLDAGRIALALGYIPGITQQIWGAD
jgi:hypothetical protein